MKRSFFLMICAPWVPMGAAVMMLAAASVFGRAGTDRVAWRGRPVVEPGWPKALLELVNDRSRTEGWRPWFSEMPNDEQLYGFEVRDTDDINRLVEKLAAIKGVKIQVRLSPEKEARYIGPAMTLAEGNGTGVVLSVGDQQVLDEWFKAMPEVSPGVRKRGVWELREAPTAQPPTLIIYAGHRAVDLKKLKVPGTVEVVADTSDSNESAGGAVKGIEEYTAKRKGP